MNNLKIKILGISSLITVVLCEVFRAAINSCGADYNTLPFAPVRVISLLSVDFLVLFVLLFFTSRIINDRGMPTLLKSKKIQYVFLTIGVFMSLADAIRDAILDPSTINSSLAVISMFTLWIAVASYMSLSEVSGSKKTYRIIRASVSLLISAVTLIIYVLFWISAFYRFGV